MKIRCPNCQKIFDANSQQENLLDYAIKNNQHLVMLECPTCFQSVPINPNNLLSKEAQKDDNKENENSQSIECPVCHEGIVSYITNGNEKFWGCGECGNVWFSKEAPNNDPSLSGKRTSMDMDGNIPNNKTLPNGKQTGRTQGEYNEATHFNNTDPLPKKSNIPVIPISTNDRDSD